MGSGSVLSLLFQISADPTKAQAAIEQFDAQLSGTLTRAASNAEDSGKQISRHLGGGLEQVHQGARLLEADLGIRLPRAVTNALGEMLPQIGYLGEAFVGVFAVEKIWDWGKAGVDAIHQLQGEIKPVADQMDRIIQEQRDLLISFDTSGQGQKNIEETTKRLGDVNEEIEKLNAAMKSGEAGDLEKRAAAVGSMWGGPMLSQAAAESATVVDNAKKLNDLTAEKITLEDRLHQQSKQMVKVEGDDKRAGEEAAKAAERRRAEALAAHQKFLEDMSRQDGEWQRRTQRALKENAQAAAKAMKDALDMNLGDHQPGPTPLDKYLMPDLGSTDPGKTLLGSMAPAFTKLTAAQREALPVMRDVNKVNEVLLKLVPEKTDKEREALALQIAKNPHIQKEIEDSKRLTSANYDLERSIAQLAGTRSLDLTVSEQWSEAGKAEARAVAQDMVGSIEQLTSATMGLIAGRRAQAAVEVPFEIAQGIRDTALGWAGNPGAFIAAGLPFEAAASYAKIAGTNAGRHGGGSGGAGGRSGGRGSDRGGSGSYGGSRQPVDRSAGGGGSNGGGSASATTVLQISGNLNANGQQQLAAWVGMGSAVGMFKLNSSGSSGISAPRA